MKTKNDFTTNSSSSSFVCQICGRQEEGYDMSLSEAEMYECDNGHTFCYDEILVDPTIEDYKDYIINRNKEYKNDYPLLSKDELIKLISDESSYRKLIMPIEEMGLEDWHNYADNEFSFDYELPEKFCPICAFIEYSQNDLKWYLYNKFNITEDEVFAVVKEKNKRRKKLYTNEYNTYVCMKFNLNPSDIVAGWKEEFGTYEAFSKYLRSLR